MSSNSKQNVEEGGANSRNWRRPL